MNERQSVSQVSTQAMVFHGLTMSDVNSSGFELQVRGITVPM